MLPTKFVTALASHAHSPTWVADHRPHLAAAFASAGAAQARCTLALTLWPLTAEPPLLHDSTWRADLTTWGETAARQWKNPAALAALHDHSGHTAAAAGDPLIAESQLVRALTLWRNLTDEPRLIGTLESLLDLFRNTRQWHRALDAAFALLVEHRRQDTPEGPALHTIGTLMLQANRPTAAAMYLEQAERALGPRLDLLLQRATAAQKSGAIAAARHHLHRALSLAIDVDEVEAARIRLLLSGDT